MLGVTTNGQVAELRDLLARGALDGLPRITIGDTVTTDAELAVRAILANLEHLRQGRVTNPARWHLVAGHIERAHRHVAGPRAT